MTALGGTFVDLLDEADRADLLALGRPRSFRRGSLLTMQGEHSDVVFVLLRGRVKVSLDTLDGHEIVLSILRPGDLAGEFEAIDGGPRTAGNTALELLDCRVLAADEFREYLDTHPRAGLALLRAIIHRLHGADQRRIDSGSRDTGHRLARLLVELAEEFGRPSGTEVALDVPLTQQDLASMIASSRESLVRALTSLRSRGLVRTERRCITICDVAALRRWADH